MNRKNNTKVTCRPCKEEDNWEIEVPNGKVLKKHYATKSECIKAGKELAHEYGCELYICDFDGNTKQKTKLWSRFVPQFFYF